jgi:hypothetical protein
MYGYLILITVVVAAVWSIASTVRNVTENPIDDGAKEITRFRGNKLFDASLVEELILTDQYVMGRRFEASGYVKRRIRYADIAQINVKKGLVACEIEVVNRGGGDNVKIKALSHEDAIRAQQMIEARRSQNRISSPDGNRVSQLERLAALADQGILSAEEFAREKSRILAG